jgi:transcriptional regulator with XRE-family HTH domain
MFTAGSMAKSEERNKALELRQKGESIKEIAKKLRIAKSTVSYWCRDIKLTPAQIQRLHKRMIIGGYRGRLKGARMQYERRLKITKELKKQGEDLLGLISVRDFMVAGAALYWGEGSKKEKQGVRVTNSDPEIIKFMLKWFIHIWGIRKNQINLSIMINKIHGNRVKEIEEYWSKLTKIPLEQFHKTILIKAKNKKNYKNFPTHFGTLTINIKKSTNLHRQIIGMIEGLRRPA